MRGRIEGNGDNSGSALLLIGGALFIVLLVAIDKQKDSERGSVQLGKAKAPFIIDDGDKIARVIKWDTEGNPTVIYPGKSGGIIEKTGLPFQYKLESGWRPTNATDFTKAIRPSGSTEMIELRMWQNEFSTMLQEEKRPYPMSGQERRRAVLEARIKRGEPVPDKLLAEFPDLKPTEQAAKTSIPKILAEYKEK